MNENLFLAIQVRKDDADFLASCKGGKELSHSVLQTSGFDGATEVMTVLVTLTTAAMPFIASVLKEQIRSRRYVKIVYKGAQIQGISEDNIEKLINALAKNEKQ